MQGFSKPSPCGARAPNSLPKCSTMAREKRIAVRLGADELARLEELCPDGMSHGAYIRSLIMEASPAREVDFANREEALTILSRMARDGKVAAAVALARELRTDGQEAAPDDELARILRGG